ncbi:MAG: shikimate dehydrogenase [Rhodospirillales bacterium]|nr:shikimate dehydrogenase [Rhodospirillales bacterium]MDH3790630.1 shikimate dehydrogenase [Rhodospirillales bacterium]MDH3912327.1 shikimate dehydrogenase [Rhodospirillales bacterium]MDH3918222.1 shikimate dehydrogenase [Rhodospirillales bacterium]MDH3965730.1 shikimate dehydrogenase [Rhodospirillales bacterium]
MTLSGRAKLAGVIGWPVEHSRSPRLHGYWLQHHQIDGAYVPLPVRSEAFERALRSLADLGFRGVNVTVPYKEAALAACDEVEESGRRLGAVNTIVMGNGQLRGFNSDGFGFIENLRRGGPGWQAKEAPAVVIGAGGAARAVVAALIDAEVPEIRVVNRTRPRADAVAKDLGGPVRVLDWPQRGRALSEAGLLVNATSLGMTGQPPLELDLADLPMTAMVNDIVYAPLETPLLARARARGNLVVDGLGMLLHQARPGFAAWFGIEPEVTAELRRFVLAD